MKTQDYTVSITVNATVHQAFESINNVTKWWTENLEGHSKKLNDVFTVRFGDVHMSTQKLVEVVPDKRVVWLVTDSPQAYARMRSLLPKKMRAGMLYRDFLSNFEMSLRLTK